MSARPQSPLFAYGATLLTVVLALLAAILLESQVQAPNVSLVFVLPVVFAAAAFGWGPALVAALSGVVAYNFFLIEPRYTFRVAEAANVWALVLLLIVAAVVSAIAAQARRRAVEAREAADHANALQALARGLVGETARDGVAVRCAAAVSQLFHAPAVVLFAEDEGLRCAGAAGSPALSEVDLESARWSLAAGLPTRGGTYPAADAAFDFWPLTTPHRQQAVIGVRISGDEAGRPEAPERLIDIVAGYLSVALEREAYASQLLENRVQTAGERLKADLLAAVSHDLRTPLSTILLSLQSLRRFEGSHDAQTRADLLAAAEAETARLSRMVENLLDMNRVEAGALPVQPAPSDPAALVATALSRAAPTLAGHRVLNETVPGPSLLVDAFLFESALVNLLENAGKYAPQGSTVRIESGADEGMGWVEVVDEGPGFGGPPEPLFEKFVRGQAGDGRAPGTGLGLSIARGFLEAQGGRVEASDRADRPGARVRLVAPLAAA